MEDKENASLQNKDQHFSISNQKAKQGKPPRGSSKRLLYNRSAQKPEELRQHRESQMRATVPSQRDVQSVHGQSVLSHNTQLVACNQSVISRYSKLS